MTRSLWQLGRKHWKEAGSVKASSICTLRVYELGSDGRKAAADATYRRLQLPDKKRSIASELMFSF